MLKSARNTAMKYGSKVAQVGTGLMVAAGSAMAAVDPAVTTAITDGTADGKTIALGILTLIIVVGIIKHVRRGA